MPAARGRGEEGKARTLARCGAGGPVGIPRKGHGEVGRRTPEWARSFTAKKERDMLKRVLLAAVAAFTVQSRVPPLYRAKPKRPTRNCRVQRAQALSPNARRMPRKRPPRRARFKQQRRNSPALLERALPRNA